MKSEYVTLLTIIISLLSGWGGAIISGYFSRKASTDTIELEHKLEIKKRKEKERVELLDLYVTIIKLDYEKNPVDYGYNGEARLDHNLFHEVIRPKIYDKYYLIHDNVIIHFNEIENKNSMIENSDLFGGFDESDITDIAHSYILMIHEIKLIVDKQRASFE